MAEPIGGPITRCPWCSAALPAAGVDRCPSCGATLATATGTEPQLPGVTTLDAEAILRARAEVSRPRSRILSFITGDLPPETAGPASAESLAPPSSDVRREMLRLQIEAERADLEAETVALKADALAQQGIHLADIGGGPDAVPEEGASPVGAPEATGVAPVEAGAAVPDAPPPAPGSGLA